MGYSQGEARNQGRVFPVSLNQLIPAEHLVRAIEAQVARLEVREMGLRSSRRLAAHPEMMARRRATGRVLLRQSKGARTEMALACQPTTSNGRSRCWGGLIAPMG